LRRRPFICHYYRLEPPSAQHFWCSHNELGNIWTHILAAVAVFAQLMYWVWNQDLHGNSAELVYRAGVFGYFISCICTFCISVQYHWRLCSTDADFLRWMCLDQSACFVVIMIGFFAGVPMGFACFPMLQIIYTISSFSTCLLMAVAIFFIPKERWEIISGVIIAGTVVVYFIPAVHWLWVCETGRRAIGTKFVVQILLTGVAAIFYTKYVPERFAPGKFDLWWNSHQIWHVAIFLSMAIYGDCLVQVNRMIQMDTFCG